jgi:hypothetical protein
MNRIEAFRLLLANPEFLVINNQGLIMYLDRGDEGNQVFRWLDDNERVIAVIDPHETWRVIEL